MRAARDIETLSELSSVIDQADLEPTPRAFGRYRVLEELGRGGMAQVYRVDRTDGQFDQPLALKVLAAEPSDLSRAWFARERQILARLQHPNIARIVDGGVTSAGRPFLVMDFVDGTPIDEYCREESIGLHSRLKLLSTVCEAVQAAHQQLIVHRDLKPSNILVTRSGTVKLLDFGIAKLLDEEGPQLTQTLDLPLTLQYASPEQLLGRAVTVESDVYQLGLLAYELITSKRPYELDGRTPATVERMICEDEPRRPSTRISESSSGGETRRLPIRSSEYREDLDWVVLRALSKDPHRRYGSAAKLEEDLQRYLGGFPVHARPASASYRLRRFVTRNRWTVLAACLAFSIIVGLTTVFAWRLTLERNQTRLEADRAERKRVQAEQLREEAEEVVGFLTGLFEASSPYREDGGAPLMARDLLERGAEQLDSQFKNRPLIRARLLQTLGRVYRASKDFDRAETFYRRALSLREASPGSDPVALADGLADLGYLLAHLWRLEEAEEALQRSLALKETALGTNHEDLVKQLGLLMSLRISQNDWARAEEIAERALRLHKAGHADEWLAWILEKLADSLISQDRAEQALPLIQQALEAFRELYRPDHLFVANARALLARYHFSRAEFEEALEINREVLAAFENQLPEDHSDLLPVLNNLALCLNNLSRSDEALAFLDRALVISRTIFGDRHPTTTRYLTNVGATKLRIGDAAGAVRDFRAVRKIQEEVLPPSHRQHAYTLLGLGSAERELGDYSAAEATLSDARRRIEASSGPESRLNSYALLLLAEVHRDRGSLESAGTLLGRAVAIRRETFPPEAEARQEAIREYASILRALNRKEEAANLEAEEASLRSRSSGEG